MTGDQPLPRRTAVLPAVPDQRRRRRSGNAPGDRIVLQVHGIDAWCAAMTVRQQLLCSSGGSRDAQMDRARRLDVLRRTHVAMVATTARELARESAPKQCVVATAVVAHSHPWIRDKVSASLVEHGFKIVLRTDNGADALGAVVAEQPDLLFSGDRLAMMTGEDLFAETALFSPFSLRMAQADQDRAGALRAAGADAVLPRHVPPADVALSAARLLTAAVQSEVPS